MLNCDAAIAAGRRLAVPVSPEGLHEVAAGAEEQIHDVIEHDHEDIDFRHTSNPFNLKLLGWDDQRPSCNLVLMIY